jgi:hypothetical protein
VDDSYCQIFLVIVSKAWSSDAQITATVAEINTAKLGTDGPLARAAMWNF